MLPYNMNSKKFSRARINLCTHVTSKGCGYLNERTITILGSGGLLFVDPVCDIQKNLTNGVECILMESNDPTLILQQIKEILAVSDKTLDLIRFKGQQLALDRFTWDHWAQHLHVPISKRFFSPETYVKLHDLPQEVIERLSPEYATVMNESDKTILWDYWTSKGNSLGHSCVTQNIPGNFDDKAYLKLNFDLSATKYNTREKIWSHWVNNGRREGRFCCFTDDNDSSSQKPATSGNSAGGGGGPNALIQLIMDDVLTASQWFELNNIFSDFLDKSKTNEALEKLATFCAQHPKLVLMPEMNTFMRLFQL